MSVLRVPDHFPRAKGCPAEAAALFACLHEHTAQTPDEIFDGGAKGGGGDEEGKRAAPSLTYTVASAYASYGDVSATEPWMPPRGPYSRSALGCR